MLIAGRDETFHRFLGPGNDDPRPTGCIVVDDEVVGWIDYDVDRTWLGPGEVNVGYNVFAPHRGKGYATRAVQLLMHHLALDSEHQTATVLIHPLNDRSLALAARSRFAPYGDLDGNSYFKRPVPPLTYTDATVTIRRLSADDLDADLEAKDDAQMDWLWLPGQRQSWEAMSPDEQRAMCSSASRRTTARSGPDPSGPSPSTQSMPPTSPMSIVTSPTNTYRPERRTSPTRRILGTEAGAMSVAPFACSCSSSPSTPGHGSPTSSSMRTTSPRCASPLL